MTTRPPVNQFHSGTAAGDAVTNSMLEIQRELRALGYDSQIYAEHLPAGLRDRIRPIEEYRGEPDGVLIVHHSMGHRVFDQVLGLPDRFVTMYHNITPDAYLMDESTRWHARLGRDQLRVLAARSEAGIAASNFNRRELLDAGFRRVSVLPPRTDYSSFKRKPGEPDWWRTNDWLFVGRLIENKCQHDIIEAFAVYAATYHPSARLLLVGDQANRPYVARLQRLATDLGVDDRVLFKGKLSDRDLLTVYRESGLFVCLSEHEGFGVPLLEAMATGLPVVALGRAAVPETLGGAGILIHEKDPATVAALAKVVLDDDELRARLVARQFERVERVETFDVAGVLQDVIDQATTGRRSLSVQVQGPFETSYSLATLNRELALALNEYVDLDVSIYATEGPGDYVPASADLVEHPDAAELYVRSAQEPYPDVAVRQMYPPRVYDSLGGITCQYFGWEESLLPAKYASSFNEHVDGIGVYSEFVAQVLRDSGVTVPIEVVGVGVTPHDRQKWPRQPELDGLKSFRFLHISSAFPRKAVDVLLDAYFAQFRGSDDVSLILKTFPNPHNDVATHLARLRSEYPDPPDVRWIDRDLRPDQVRSLYNVASCYVHAVRGEGFGLPVAEAMLARVPVITVSYSGLADFCSDETVLAVPYRIEPARTHLSVPGSTWAEPDVGRLGDLMREVVANPGRQDIADRIDRAERLIEERFTWHAVGERWNAFIRRLEQRRRVPRIAMVTTWNKRCGIAENSRYIVAALGRHADVEVYADQDVEIVDPSVDGDVTRCWRSRWQPDLSSLQRALDRSTADIVHIQFNFGFFELERLAALIETELARRAVVVTIHRSKDVDIDGVNVSLADIRPTLEKLDCLIVHQQRDADILAELGINARIALVPLGVRSDTSLPDRRELRQALGLGARPVLATFGFLLPHKGTLELIQAVDELRRSFHDIHLLCVCAIHPDGSSAHFRMVCEQEIRRRRLERHVTLITDFLPEPEAHALLSAADLIVMPYRETEESASAAMRFAMAAGRPIAAPPLAIFADVRSAVAPLPAVAPDALAHDVADLLKDKDRLDELAAGVRALSRSLSWDEVGRQHREIYLSLLEDDRTQPDRA